MKLGKLGRGQEDPGDLVLLDPERPGPPGAGQKAVADSGGDGLQGRLVGTFLLASLLARPAPSRPGLGPAPLEGLEDLFVEILAVILGDLCVAYLTDDLREGPLQTGAALRGREVVALRFRPPQDLRQRLGRVQHPAQRSRSLGSEEAVRVFAGGEEGEAERVAGARWGSASL